jgi:PAS domain S-box-containing protein
MNEQTILYLIPFLISLGITSAVGIYAWSRRLIVGARPFALAVLGQALWTSGYILELLQSDLGAKIFWDNFQLIGGILYPIGTLAFALQYTDRKLTHPIRTWVLITLPPAITTLIYFTNEFHGFVRPGIQLIPGEPFPALSYDFVFLDWVAYSYLACIHLVALYLLITRYLHTQSLYRRQVGLIFIGALIPMIGTTLTLTGIAPTFHRDTTPFTFAISNLIIAWGLFRYRLFDIVPIARDSVIDNMHDALFVLDSKGRVVDLNPAALALIGQKAGELIGQPGVELFANWPDLAKRFPAAEEGRTEITTGEGKNQRHFEINITSLRDRREHLSGRLILVHEITERVNVERELEAANKELESFAYSVSHDLRAPLRAIDGYSQALLEDYEAQLDNMGKAYLQFVRESSQHMAQLIEDLLRLSRVMRSELIRTQVDLSALVTSIAGELQTSQPDRQVEFIIAPGLVINADPNLIHILLQNLLDNAWKFTSRNPTARIEVGLLEKEKGKVYYVRDDGAGFNMAYSDKLFDPFQRLHSAHEFEGTGIGLATVQRIVKRHNGRVWAEGVEEKGATVYFTI